MLHILSLARRYLAKDGSVSFWHTPLSRRKNPWPGRDYPIDLKPKMAYAGPRDAAGIPMLDYKGRTGVQYNPCAVAQLGLGHCQDVIDGNAHSLGPALALGEWLISWSELRSDGTRWLPYRFSIPEFGLNPPFYSGLAQGNAISLLLRLGLLAGEERYVRAAHELVAPMLRPVVEGGLSREVDGMWLIEEFVMQRLSAVLDGWMYAILALGDLANLTPSHERQQLFAHAVLSLEQLLPRFDLGYWSRADLYISNPPMPASHFYHQLHVLQLEALAMATGSPILGYYAVKWRRNWESRSCRGRALAAKVIMKCLRY